MQKTRDGSGHEGNKEIRRCYDSVWGRSSRVVRLLFFMMNEVLCKCKKRQGKEGTR